MNFKVLHEKFVRDNFDKNYEVCIYFVSNTFENLDTNDLLRHCKYHLKSISNPDMFSVLENFDEMSVKDWFIAPNEKHEKIYHVLLKH